MIPLVDLGAAHEELDGALDEAIRGVLAHRRFVRGPEVGEFESRFAAYCGASHAVGVGNGTDALVLVLRCLGIGPGDEVVVPANTFVATAEAVGLARAEVVFCDVEPETRNLSARTVEPVLTERTRAIVPVHLYGRPAPLDELAELAESRGLRIVQDAAQAHGARYRDRPLAGWGDAICFSFFPSKNLGALGDAGAVVTRDPALADAVRAFADHGRRGKHDHAIEGTNSRLDTLQAAVLLAKLPSLDEWNDRRRRLAERYTRGLQEVPGLQVPTPDDPGTRSVWHLYVVRVEGRDSLRRYLADRGIQTGLHYPRALPFLPAYAERGYRIADFPVSARLQDDVLSLPMYPQLAEDAVEAVVEAIREWRAEPPVRP